MSKISELDLSVVINSTLEEMLNLGFEVKQGHNFKQFKKDCANREGRPLSHHADDSFFDFTEANSFFLTARDIKSGELCGTIAARKDDLGKDRLVDILEPQYARLYDGVVGTEHSPGMYKITGSAVYQGDLWVKTKRRGSMLGVLLPRLSLLLSLRMNPQFVYALVVERMATNLVNKIGYSNTERAAIDWVDCPEDFNADFWLTYSTNENIDHLARRLCAQIRQTQLT